MRKLFNSKTIKILSTIIMVGIVFCVPVFAEDSNSRIANLGVSLTFIVDFLSRGRAVFALLAGKLMTNEFVYGSFMHLDVFLWKIWNIMKNMANYTLGFMFLFHIIKNLFVTKETPGDFIKTKIIGFLVAGILIQASWFLIGATLDIVTITTSAIGAFPGQFIEQDGTTQLTLKADFQKIKSRGPMVIKNNSTDFRIVGILPNAKNNKEVLKNEAKYNRFLDNITPSNSNAAGPLLYIGSSILRFHEYAAPKKSIGSWEEIFSSTMINLFVIMLFTIAMILIFIINIMRVVIIWVFICLSPILILFTVLEKMKVGGSTDKALPKRLKFGSVMSMIFKPVIYTAYLSLILIFMTSIHRIIGPGKTTKMGGVSVSSQVTKDPTGKKTDVKSELDAGELGSIKMGGIQNSLSDLILFMFALFLCRQLVKISASGNDFTKKIVNIVSQGIKSVPIIPIPRAGGMSIGGIEKASTRRHNYVRSKYNIDIKTGQFDIAGRNAFYNKVNNWMGSTPTFTAKDATEFDTFFINSQNWAKSNSSQLNTHREEFFEKSKKIAKKLPNGLKFNNKKWNLYLKKLLEVTGGYSIKFKINNEDKIMKIPKLQKNESVQDYLSDPKNKGVKAAIISNMMGINYTNAENNTSPINQLVFY